MKTNKLKSSNIYIQSTVALLFIQFVHKIVREIPGALKMGGAGAKVVPVFAVVLIISIILILIRRKIGLFIGIFAAAYMIFQPIFVHIITAHPDQNGIWWYPVFPWIQAIMIIYFSILTLCNEKIIQQNNN